MRCAVCACVLLAAVSAAPAPEGYGAPPPPAPGGPAPLPAGGTPGLAAAGGGRGRYYGRLGGGLGGSGGPLSGGPIRPLDPIRSGPLGGLSSRPLDQYRFLGPRRGAFSEDRFINRGNPSNLLPNGFVDGPSRPYAFDYEVLEPEFGNDYGHAEESDGVVTQGEYHVLLPDGRTQIVTYSVEGNSGFQAVVRYDGEVQFPLAGTPRSPGFGGPLAGAARDPAFSGPLVGATRGPGFGGPLAGAPRGPGFGGPLSGAARGPAFGGPRRPLNRPVGGALAGPLGGSLGGPESLDGPLEAQEPSTSYGI